MQPNFHIHHRYFKLSKPIICRLIKLHLIIDKKLTSFSKIYSFFNKNFYLCGEEKREHRMLNIYYQITHVIQLTKTMV